jgi:hypothetical protein
MTAQGQPLNIEMKFTRKLLEQLTVDLIDRTLKIVARVLVDSGLSTKEIDEVILVGGQTRMPIVQDRLTKFFGKAPSKGVHPDEAVAIGAALYAHSLQDDTNLRIQLLDVIPMAIGLEKAGGEFHQVFPRNAAIPNAKQIVGTRFVVIIKGHASKDDFAESTPALQFMDISIRRAQLAADYLVKAGVSPDILRVQGCSTFEPVIQRRYGPDAQANNRRVEVEVTATLVGELQDQPAERQVTADPSNVPATPRVFTETAQPAAAAQ